MHGLLVFAMLSVRLCVFAQLCLSDPMAINRPFAAWAWLYLSWLWCAPGSTWLLCSLLSGVQQTGTFSFYGLRPSALLRQHIRLSYGGACGSCYHGVCLSANEFAAALQPIVFVLLAALCRSSAAPGGKVSAFVAPRVAQPNPMLGQRHKYIRAFFNGGSASVSTWHCFQAHGARGPGGQSCICAIAAALPPVQQLLL